jgi:uncharacterized membrane protein
MKSPKEALKTYFVTGLLMIVPIVLSIWLLKTIIVWVDEVFAVQQWSPVFVPGFGLVLALVIILIVGAFGRNVIGTWFVGIFAEVFRHVPLIGSVYSGLRQTLSTLFSSTDKKFGRAVLIEWPRKEIWTIALLTTESAPPAVSREAGSDLVTVFVPTTPNPTGGFLLFLPKKDIRPLGIKADEALKLIVSLGLADEGSQRAPNGN